MKIIPLINEITNTFNEIIESRSNNQMDAIYEKIGPDNFEMLNDLFYEFNEHFDGFEYNRCLDDLQNGTDTIRTRKLKEILIKKEEILENMKTYSLNEHGKRI